MTNFKNKTEVKKKEENSTLLYLEIAVKAEIESNL